MRSKATTHSRGRRIAVGVAIGMGLLAGLVWLLTCTLGNSPQYLFAGKPIREWQEQLNGRDTGASNEAFAVVTRQVIPQLTDILFHDTNDSCLRISLIETLNQLPGVNVYFTAAGGRRATAAQSLGALGPAATSAVPALIQVLKSKDTLVHGTAIYALGKIHSDPETVIPLLIGYLGDDELNDEAALALANYGSLAKAAVPHIIPMLHAPDKDAQNAAAEALKKIDAEAYVSAMRAADHGSVTERQSARTGGEGESKPK